VFIHIHAYSYYNYWQREFVNVNGYFLLTKEINIRDKGWYFFS